MEQPTSPIRPTDDQARIIAHSILAAVRYGALATIETTTGAPMATKIAVGYAPDEGLFGYLSDLAQHTQNLRANVNVSLLLETAADKGDPMNAPRLTLMAKARRVERDTPEHNTLRDLYLARFPKAKLYIGFTDFAFYRFDIAKAHLNGGFGKAFVLTPADLGA